MYSQKFIVRSNEIDVDLSISYPSLIRMMQETSMQHIIKLKASFWDMKDQETTWVLLKKEIKFIGTAGMNEELEVRTYPSGFNRIFAYRDYHIYTSDGSQKIAEASSSWALIDLNTRRPKRIDSNIFDQHVPTDVDFIARPEFKINTIDKVDYRRTYQVAYYDLDWNGHANNTMLIKQLLSSIAQSFHERHRLSHFSIQFKNECFNNDQLYFETTYLSEHELHHQVIRQEDGKVICYARSIWHKKRA